MIEAIVRGSVRHRRAVFVLFGALVATLAWVGSRLSFDALPDVTPNQVLVLTRAPGLTPEEVERRVTRPIEAALGGVPGMVEQRSSSRPGLSAVIAIFEDDADPWRARQLVAERLATVSVPEGVEAPELGPHSGGLGEIFQFTLSSPSRSAAELLEIAERRVAPLLRAVGGVVEVNTWGGSRRTFSVEADPDRMAARGISLAELRQALETAVGGAAGGSLRAGGGQAMVRSLFLPAQPADLAAVVVRADEKGVVRVADVAEAVEGSLPRLGAATIDGRGETVYVMAQMLRGENALRVIARIHEALPRVRAALPADVQLQLVYDRSELVYATLRTVATNLVEGGLLVVAVLFAMLGSLRAGLLVAAAIPFSMLFAGAGMVLLGIPGNLMSLGAIDFGLVVDGAVVMVEAIFHHLDPREHPERRRLDADPAARRRHVAEVAEGIARPVFFSVVVILLVYVPVVTLTGVDGKMFRPMALTMILALAGSLLYALAILPALSSALLRPKDVPPRDPLLVRLIDRVYRPLLQRVLPRPFAVALVTLALLAGGGALLSTLGTEFIPQLDEGDLVIQVARSPDISIETAVEEAGRLERAVLGAAPEVRQVVSRIGSPAVATDTMGIEQADVFVRIAPRSAWRPGLEREELIAAIEAAIERESPGGDPAFTQPIQMRFNEMVGGDVNDVSLAIYGEDLALLRTLAERARDAIARVPGAADVRVMVPPDVALVEVRPLPLQASLAGLSPGEILDTVRALQVGLHVGTTWSGPTEIPIVLRLGSQTSAFEIERLPVLAKGGIPVPLERVAEVHRIRTPSLVSHENAERRVVVGFNVRGADLGAVAAGAREAVAAAIELPEGTRIEWGGAIENLEAATGRLRLIVPGVVVLIFVLLVGAFRKVRPAAILLIQIPFATLGGITALWLRGMPVSISAIVGFIALSGIAVLNGVVLMNQVLINQRAGMPPAEAAAAAARTRARPVLTTALVAALGFVPMALATGVGAEVQRPLATVIVGGLSTSTLLTLLVLPTLYPWLAQRISGSTGSAEEPDAPVAGGGRIASGPAAGPGAG